MSYCLLFFCREKGEHHREENNTKKDTRKNVFLTGSLKPFFGIRLYTTLINSKNYLFGLSHYVSGSSVKLNPCVILLMLRIEVTLYIKVALSESLYKVTL